MDDSGTAATADAGQGDPGTQDPKAEAQPDVGKQGGDAGNLGDAGKRALEAERQARKETEAKLRDAEARLKAHDDEKLSETERLQKAASEAETKRVALEQENQELRIGHAALLHAQRLGVSDSAAAVRLLDTSLLEFEQDGRPKETSLDKAFSALLEQHPILKAEGNGAGLATGPTNPPRPRGGGSFTRAQLRDAEFFRANRDAILLAQKEGRITE